MIQQWSIRNNLCMVPLLLRTVEVAWIVSKYVFWSCDYKERLRKRFLKIFVNLSFDSDIICVFKLFKKYCRNTLTSYY